MDNLKRIFVCAALSAAVIVSVGCSNGPRQYAISGAVSYQGQPIADGQIVLEDVNGVAKWPGEIKNGRYQLQATAGPKLVRITATKETGRMLPGGMDTQVPERIDIVPAKYNRDSQEQRTVEPKGAQTIDFDLQ